MPKPPEVLEEQLGSVVRQLRRAGEGEAIPIKDGPPSSHETIGNSAASAVEVHTMRVDDELAKLQERIDGMRYAIKQGAAEVRAKIENQIELGKRCSSAAKIIGEELDTLNAGKATVVNTRVRE